MVWLQNYFLTNWATKVMLPWLSIICLTSFIWQSVKLQLCMQQTEHSFQLWILLKELCATFSLSDYGENIFCSMQNQWRHDIWNKKVMSHAFTVCIVLLLLVYRPGPRCSHVNAWRSPLLPCIWNCSPPSCSPHRVCKQPIAANWHFLMQMTL